jgi:hypothetical protein
MIRVIEENFKGIVLVILFAITVGLFLNWNKPQNGRYQLVSWENILYQHDTRTGQVIVFGPTSDKDPKSGLIQFKPYGILSPQHN